MTEYEQYGLVSNCPFSGLKIPKSFQGNVRWRKDVLRKAVGSASLRRTIKAACAKSPVYWLNLVGWTFLQKAINAEGREVSVSGPAAHVPFITWRVQDDALVQLDNAIATGNDVLISKSRDMGASWIVLAMFHHKWQFRPASTFLELSRKEALVDRRGDMDSLFEKHRYLLRWQPEWLRPRIKDHTMHLENLDIGCAIEGESTNSNAGQASRKTAILLDEFARVAEGAEIDLATADTSPCRIFNSTPSGPNTQFTRIWKSLQAKTRRGVVIELPWWRHPDKGKGAEQRLDHETGKQRWTSPWYEDQKTRRSKKNIAQNLDMEHGRAGDSFFDTDDIEKHRALYAREPVGVGNVVYDIDMPEEAKFAKVRKFSHEGIEFFENSGRRPWRMWQHLTADANGKFRPSQTTRYVFGIDVSAGTGASNSVISVLDHATGQIVAKFWDAFTSPEELAEVAVFGAIWFGGVKPPLIVFEKNGAGNIFGKKLLRLGYPAIYYSKIDGQRTEQQTTRWGWSSSPTKKETLLGEYREALKTGRIINPCSESLDEANEYIYDDHGRLEPGTVGAEDGGGKALHGDHVIADALLLQGQKDLPKTEKVEEIRPPQGSFADRRRSHMRKLQEKDVWSR
jgi:hypothetical protein